MEGLKKMAQDTIYAWIEMNESQDKEVMMQEMFDQTNEQNRVFHSEMECWNFLEEAYELWDIIQYAGFNSNLIYMMNDAWQKVGREIIYEEDLKEKWEKMVTPFFKTS